MSLSSSRRSSRQRVDDGEFFLECKAAFLAIYDDITDKIESKKSLNIVLQQSGRNPSKVALNKYWPRDTEQLSFNDFVDICRKEPITTADDLMKAFRKIDINGDGYISLDELYKIMSAQGESMSRDDVRKMIDEVDDNKDGRLDYREFTNMIMKTTEDAKKFSMKMMEKKERKKKRGDRYASEAMNTNSNSLVQDSIKSEELKQPQRSNKQMANESKSGFKNTGDDCESYGNSLGGKETSISGSKVSPKSGQGMSGSRTSLKSEQKVSGPGPILTSEQSLSGSRTSLRSDQAVLGSRASVKSQRSKVERPHKKPKELTEAIALDPQESATIETSARSSLTYVQNASNEKVGELSTSKSSVKSSHTNIIGEAGLPGEQEDLGKEISREATKESPKEPADDIPPQSHRQDTQNSARSVAEELDFDDNADIVSTGRPTPRVDLHTSSRETSARETSARETSRKDDIKTNKSETSLKDSAGKPNQKALKSDEASSIEHIEPLARKSSAKNAVESKSYKGTEKVMNDDKGKTSDMKLEDGFSAPRPKARRSGILNDIKSERREELQDDQEAKEEVKSPALLSRASNMTDEIFKTSARSESNVRRSSTDQKSAAEENAGDADDHDSKKGLKNKPPHAGTKAMLLTDPELVESRQNPSSAPEPALHKSADINENGYGSQASLRSGDRELGSPSAPVPSPRKSASSRLSEDDIPKPSPRVRRDVKGKSSVKSKEKLPDARSLRDWNHCTSKGCFFYEEEEIVSHIYKLELREDSSVYLSAHPIQEPACLNLPCSEPIDTALFVLDGRGRVVAFTELRDVQGTYGVKCDLPAGEYQILPFTTGCRFKQRTEQSQHNVKESKLVKKDKDDKIVITSGFRKALEDIFDLCDLDNNGTMSRDEFNWFNLRTSGEELGEDEWEVVEERTQLEDGEITKAGFIELNEMEAEDANGDVGDLWITLTSMGLNKALIMDEACPFRLDVYTQGRKKPNLNVTGIESIEKHEFLVEICQALIEKAGDPTKIRNMKDLYSYTYKNDHWATIVIDNRSRSSVSVEADCSKSRNVTSNHDSLDHTVEIDPQDMVVAHHLMPHSELSDWTVSCTETIHK